MLTKSNNLGSSWKNSGYSTYVEFSILPLPAVRLYTPRTYSCSTLHRQHLQNGTDIEWAMQINGQKRRKNSTKLANNEPLSSSSSKQMSMEEDLMEELELIRPLLKESGLESNEDFRGFLLHHAQKRGQGGKRSRKRCQCRGMSPNACLLN